MKTEILANSSASVVSFCLTLHVIKVFSREKGLMIMIMMMIIKKIMMIMITTQVTVSLGARALLHCTVVGDSHHTVFKINSK